MDEPSLDGPSVDDSSVPSVKIEDSSLTVIDGDDDDDDNGNSDEDEWIYFQNIVAFN